MLHNRANLCTGIIFNTRELEKGTIISLYCLFHSMGIIFNTHAIGDVWLRYFHPKHLFRCPGIFFNTRAGGVANKEHDAI